MKQYSHIFFDLDGTLTDPGVGITSSVMYALERFGIRETDRTALYKFIGPPLLDSFQAFYGFSPEESRAAAKPHRQHRGPTGTMENAACPGMPATQAALTCSS